MAFCTNCGEQEYYIEKLDHVNFIDINYATVVQTIKYDWKQSFTQAWVETPLSQKLLCVN